MTLVNVDDVMESLELILDSCEISQSLRNFIWNGLFDALDNNLG